MRPCMVNKLTIGGDAPPRVMGVINCSPESFYHDSFIPTNEIHEKAVGMIEAGADILDVGARSTAPNAQAISGSEEASRIDAALRELDGTGFTISVDTMNPWVLDTCLKHEIHAVNDIAGFSSGAYVKRVADAGLPAFVMATDYTPGDAVGPDATEKTLRPSSPAARLHRSTTTCSTRVSGSGPHSVPMMTTGNSAGTSTVLPSSTARSLPQSRARASSATS